MKFSLFYFPQLGMGDPASYERRLIGNDPAQFAHLLEDVKLQAQLAEERGFYGVYFAEHHFDVEGFELCANPLLFDCWVGMNTRRLKIGQLGLVLPSWNPLRLAEDVAMMAHMFGDRFEIGFARGAQTREVAPLAAAHQVEGAHSDHSASDERNRRLFREHYEILMAALTEDFLSYEGEFNRIPPRGLVWLNPATQKYGGGVEPDGRVTSLAVVPKLPGRKLPLRWQAFTASEETMRWAAQQGMNLAAFEVHPERQRSSGELFQEESRKAGRDLAFGEGVGYVRTTVVLDDGDEARRWDKLASDRVWGEWFHGIGFTNGIRFPEDPPGEIDYSYDLIYERHFTFAGDPDEVTRRIERLHQQTNLEHFILHVHGSALPRDVQLRSLETFAQKVMPRFDAEPAPETS